MGTHLEAEGTATVGVTPQRHSGRDAVYPDQGDRLGEARRANAHELAAKARQPVGINEVGLH